MRHITSSITLSLIAAAVLCAQSFTYTSAGGGPNNMQANYANLNGPGGVASLNSTTFYIAVSAQNRIFKVDGSGFLTVLAGSGLPGYAGDQGPATSAMLNGPLAVAVDGPGNVYIADWNNNVVRKVDTSGVITTIAGIAGQCGFNGNGSPATSFQLCEPGGVAVDTTGNLYIADFGNCRVRKLVMSTNTISTLAGSGTCGYTGDGGPAINAQLNTPFGVAADSASNVYFSDINNCRIREVVHSTAKIKTVGGNGVCGFAGDGGPATSANLGGGGAVVGVAVDTGGTAITIADGANSRIRRFPLGGAINTIAGSATSGFCGDFVLATNACLYYPESVALGNFGAIYVADYYNLRVREFVVGGNLFTIAGNGSATDATPVSGLPPTSAVLAYPTGVLADPSNNIFVSDTGNFIVRESVGGSTLNILAGTGVAGFSGDTGSPAVDAQFAFTYGLTRDSSGNIYIADETNCAIRQVTPAGLIYTYAGLPQNCGYSGDTGPALWAQLYFPQGIYMDSNNVLYIADTSNHVVRKVFNGTITPFAGTGAAGYGGDGGPAAAAELNAPGNVTGDAAGNVYIADTVNCRIRKVSALTGNITTVAGNGACGFTGDGPAAQNSLSYPEGLTADANGNLFIADTNNQRMRWVSPAGLMTTFAGTGTPGMTSDMVYSADSEFYQPMSISETSTGYFMIADQYNLRVRTVSPFPGVGASTGSLSFTSAALGTTSAPQAVTLSGIGPASIYNISTNGDFAEYDNCGASLTNGTTCTVYVTFTPTASGVRTGILAIEHNGIPNGVTTVELQGNGSALAVTGGPLAFGGIPVKTVSAAKPITVTNKGTLAIAINSVTLSEATDFTIASNNCPVGSSLAASASCTIGVTFTPKSSGAKKGGLVIQDGDPGSPHVAGMSGTGTSKVVLNPAAYTFAPQTLNTTATTFIMLKNTTAAVLTLGTPAVSLTGANAFTMGANTTCTNAKKIPVNGTCNIYVSFEPTASGNFSGLITVTDSDATSPQTVSLLGTGTSLQFSPTAVNFGTVVRGGQSSQLVTVTNVDVIPVHFTAGVFYGSYTADFSAPGNALPCGGTLFYYSSCSFTMYFTPQLFSTGTENVFYRFYDDNPGSPQQIQVTGTAQ